MSFEIAGAWFRYAEHQPWVLRDVSAAFRRGQHTAVVGPNGAGKSTLLRVLLGRLRCGRGEATYEGRPSWRWPRRELARRVGVVGQEKEVASLLTVNELVALGRSPYLRGWSGLGESDRRIVAGALQATDLAALAQRRVSQLSGGEFQRARLARALAQEPECLLLDEPTAHLDMGHEMEIFQLVSHLCVKKSLTVVTITHNINLAARFSDHMLMLAGGELAASGSPSEVVVPATLEAAFRWPIAVRDLGTMGLHAIPLDRPGDGARWL